MNKWKSWIGHCKYFKQTDANAVEVSNKVKAELDTLVHQYKSKGFK